MKTIKYINTMCETVTREMLPLWAVNVYDHGVAAGDPTTHYLRTEADGREAFAAELAGWTSCDLRLRDADLMMISEWDEESDAPTMAGEVIESTYERSLGITEADLPQEAQA